ncbi:Hypothetical protein SynRCC307_1077 [Synechococcus sp. RCC307]|nr:Hypothetical protein SynRCC307_1077 [Synechococcus sp. RCC307]
MWWFWFGAVRQALDDPAWADIHHVAVDLAADLHKVGIAGSRPAFDVEHLRQIGLLTRRVNRDNITYLDIEKDRPHALTPEVFTLVHAY